MGGEGNRIEVGYAENWLERKIDRMGYDFSCRSARKDKRRGGRGTTLIGGDNIAKENDYEIQYACLVNAITACLCTQS